MTTRFSILAAAVLCVTGLTAPALADDTANSKRAHRLDEVMARLDTDKDGKISKDEASKGRRLSKHFEQVDADHDGFVTRAELEAAFARRAAAKHDQSHAGQ
jgi:Ca2+-binding EF-hand superfamily protein